MRPSGDKVTIILNNPHKGVRCYINTNDHKLLGNEIVFDIKTMTIRRPDIDSRKVTSLKSCQFAFIPPDGNNEDYIGTYKLKQIDEDTFKLKKLKKHV